MGSSVYFLVLLSCVQAIPNIQNQINDHLEGTVNGTAKVPIAWSTATLTDKVVELERKLLTMTQRLRSDTYRPSAIAYEARLYENTNYADGDIFIFDDVTINGGDCYNKNTGVFTAPKCGTYLLWAHIMRGDKCAMNVDVKSCKKKTPILRGHVAAGTQTCGVASVSGLVYLVKGERVWVTKTARKTTLVRGRYFSSLGGTLIHASDYEVARNVRK